MTREKVQLPIEIGFLKIPTRWSLATDPRRGRVAVPVVDQSQKPVEIDGWELRRRFQRMEQTEEAALDFLEGVGLWELLPCPAQSNRQIVGNFGSRFVQGVAPAGVQLSRLWNLQQSWLKLLSDPVALKKRFGPPPTAKGGSRFAEQMTHVDKVLFALQTENMNVLPLHIEWRRWDGKLQAFGVVDTITGRELLVASVQFDLLRGAKFRICARSDCPVRFPVSTSDRKKKFCTWDCAHVVAERERRKRHLREEKRNAKK